MNKKAKSAFFGVLMFAVTLSVLFLSSFVWADMIGEVSSTAAGVANYFIISDDISSEVNISINNTDTSAFHNITNITVVLDGVIFSPGENESDTIGFTFTNFSNTRFEYGAFNLSQGNQTYIWFNVTGATPGRNASAFNISLTFANESHAINSETNLTVHVNDTFTAAANGSAMDGDRANVTFLAPANYTMNGNETEVYLNVSIWNRTQMLQANVTLAGVGGDFVINWTGENISADGTPPDEVYFLNITLANGSLNDEANIVSIGRIVIKDSTAPVVALSQDNASSTTSKIVIDITNTETLTGISGLCSVDNSQAVVSGSNLSQTITDESSLSCGESRLYTVTCTDYAGNVGSTAYTGFAKACSGGGGSSSGGSGGSGATTWRNTYSEDDFELSVKGDITRELAAKNRIKIKVAGETHYVGVVSLTETTATIEVASEHLGQFNFDIGDVKKFDFTEDGFYDMSIKLNSISANKASVTLSSISEEVSEVDELEKESDRVTPPGGEAGEEAGNLVWLWVVIIIVIVIVAVIFFVKKKK